MPLYVHRTTFQVLPSTSTASLTEPEANYVKDPSPWPFTTEPARYWLLTSDVFSVVDQATKDAIDTALLVASRDELANDIDRAETYLRAFALVVLDEFNDHSFCHIAGSAIRQSKFRLSSEVRPQTTKRLIESGVWPVAVPSVVTSEALT